MLTLDLTLLEDWTHLYKKRKAMHIVNSWIDLNVCGWIVRQAI